MFRQQQPREVNKRRCSVESPSMVDTQWNILYWRSKWIFHTVCLDAVGCEWGTNSVYFGITYDCFISSGLPVFVVGPQYHHLFFQCLSKVPFERHTQSLRKTWVKTWMGFVLQILMNFFHLRFSSVAVWHPLGCNLCKHAGGHSVTTEACTSTHFTCRGLCGNEVWKLIGTICAMLNNSRHPYSATYWTIIPWILIEHMYIFPSDTMAFMK